MFGIKDREKRPKGPAVDWRATGGLHRPHFRRGGYVVKGLRNKCGLGGRGMEKEGPGGGDSFPDDW